MSELYAVPWTIQKFAGELCWGNGCGHGQVGAISIPVGGDGGVIECIPCRQDECPHAARTMDEPMGDVQGEPVFLRKLKEPTSQGDHHV